MKKALILLFCINMFSGMGYSLVAPLFPHLQKYFSIGEALLGWIISTYAISNTCITPFIPSLCKHFSRIKLLYFSTFFEATCTFLYSFLENISSLYLFLFIVFFLRIIHGICSAFIATLVYSIACSLANEDEIKSALGYIEIGLSLGSSSGPLFASIFYHLGGYHLPFMVLGLFLYISVYLTKILGNEKIDKKEEIKEDPSFFKYLKYIDIILIFGILALGMIAFTFFFPCLTNHLTENYNLNISSSSLFFSVPVLFYFIMINFTNIISKKLGNFYSISLGLLTNIIGVYLIYPLPPFPKNIITIIVGLALIGGGGPPIFILGLLELAKNVKKMSVNYDDNTINDIASAINNLFISIGDLIGPIIGGFLSSNFGFKFCCLIIFIIFIIIFTLFFFFYGKNNDDDKNIIMNEKNNIRPLNEQLFS